ncbi:MAG: anaerobic glycerol-3-phosphate dehydrogenase subunit C [Chloroflexota bacterium]
MSNYPEPSGQDQSGQEPSGPGAAGSGSGQAESSGLGALGSARVEVDSPVFWDPADLRIEMLRQIEVCHGCRLCLPLCPDFPRLLDHIDNDVHGEVARLTDAHLADFVDWCYQCKLCFLKCPYTPPHEFMIDIPKLLLRAKAVRAKQNGGATVQDRFLGNTDGNGRLFAKIAPLANLGASIKPNRVLMEKALGIHRDRLLPKYHAQTFVDWFNKRPRPSIHDPIARVALFYTCPVNYNDPEVGQAVVKVLEHNHVEVDVVQERCCGQPQLDGGEMEAAIEKIRYNISHIQEMVDRGYDILVPEPTCGMMLKKEYPTFFAEDMGPLLPHIFDVSEYLVKMDRDGKLSKAFKRETGRVAYHMPCHLKYQAIGQQTLQLLRTIGSDVVFVDKGCSGMDGTWGMKTQYFDASLKVAHGLIEGMKAAQPATCVTDCGLSALQITQGTGLPVLHPYQLMEKAYGL